MLIFVKDASNDASKDAGTNNKLSPLMTPALGFEPGPRWWEASAITTVPPLLSLNRSITDHFGFVFEENSVREVT